MSPAGEEASGWRRGGIRPGIGRAGAQLASVVDFGLLARACGLVIERRPALGPWDRRPAFMLRGRAGCQRKCKEDDGDEPPHAAPIARRLPVLRQPAGLGCPAGIPDALPGFTRNQAGRQRLWRSHLPAETPDPRRQPLERRGEGCFDGWASHVRQLAW